MHNEDENILLLEKAPELNTKLSKLNINLRDTGGQIQIRHSSFSTKSDEGADRAFSNCGNFITTSPMRAQSHGNPPRKLNFSPDDSSTDFLGDC